jgi:glycosyltransferase involved in cell wall biosynthesis
VRILQITAFYPPGLGGIQYFVQSLSRALAGRGLGVTVLTINTEDMAPLERGADGIEIRHCKLDVSYHRGLFSAEFAARLLQARGYDLYHAHIPFPLGLEIAAASAWRNRKPLVTTHHGQGTRGGSLYTLLATSYSLFSRALSLRAVDCPIFLTHSYADSLWLPEVVRRRVRIVRTGADITTFVPDGDGAAVRGRYGIGTGVPLLLFVGSLHPGNRYKGVDYLIRALPEVARAVPDVRLMIVGGGGLLPELQELVGQLGLDGRVVFTGRVENASLPAYYAACDALVLPSIPGGSENSPVVVFEAMASGRPVVASQLPGVDEIVQHEETGLLVPWAEPEALAAALARVLGDPQFRSAAGRKARARAERYSWDHCAAEMEAIYRELIGR